MSLGQKVGNPRLISSEDLFFFREHYDFGTKSGKLWEMVFKDEFFSFNKRPDLPVRKHGIPTKIKTTIIRTVSTKSCSGWKEISAAKCRTHKEIFPLEKVRNC